MASSFPESTNKEVLWLSSSTFRAKILEETGFERIEVIRAAKDVGIWYAASVAPEEVLTF